MKKKVIIISLAALVVILASYFLFFQGSKAKESYTFGEVTNGDLNVVITSSGTLQATSTVDVGTQVSGKITKLYADFNSEVKKGQLLAVIDTTTLVAQVKDAQANLIKAKATYQQKTAIHERNKKLYEKKMISDLDFIQSQTDCQTTLSDLKSAELAVKKAKTNLDYAFIYAPIAGRVINRAVEQGQTVTASMSTPTLFTIAEDLSSMRILANVDESDIGNIKEGQQVKFTVQTYSGKSFEGTVTQIRLQPTTSSNVVNYTVVIHADNKEQLLLPGMTATVDFYVDHRDKALLIPNTALRFEPSDELMAELKKDMANDFKNMSSDAKNKMKNQAPPAPNKSISKDSMTRIYYMDANGKIKIAPIIIGITDGKNTEVLISKDLKAGMKIITGSQDESTSTSTKTKSTNTMQQNGPPPMMM
jgi:HlyD family secretion protein